MNRSVKASSVNSSKRIDVLTQGVLLTLLATCLLYFFSNRLYESANMGDHVPVANTHNVSFSESYYVPLTVSNEGDIDYIQMLFTLHHPALLSETAEENESQWLYLDNIKEIEKYSTDPVTIPALHTVDCVSIKISDHESASIHSQAIQIECNVTDPLHKIVML